MGKYITVSSLLCKYLWRSLKSEYNNVLWGLSHTYLKIYIYKQQHKCHKGEMKVYHAKLPQLHKMHNS